MFRRYNTPYKDKSYSGVLLFFSLSMKGLVLNSVHAALSMVKNKNENTARETERITLARKLLLEEDEGIMLLARFLN